MAENTVLFMFLMGVVVGIVSVLIIAALCAIEWPGTNSPEHWSLTCNEEEDEDDEST